jgi:hypothetical protein
MNKPFARTSLYNLISEDVLVYHRDYLTVIPYDVYARSVSLKWQRVQTLAPCDKQLPVVQSKWRRGGVRNRASRVLRLEVAVVTGGKMTDSQPD